MITIKCAECNARIFRYVKIGKGKLIRCYKDRIERDNSLRRGNEVLCPCGNLIGLDEGRWIKMIPDSFTYSGSVTGK
jgi:hypothetical protein